MEREIDVLLSQPGDTLKVILGTEVPADGVVIWGTSHVDERMVTGESIPVLKEVSSVVIGGTMKLHGVLHVKATKVGSDTALSQIMSLVETAQLSKAPIQKFVDYLVSQCQTFIELVSERPWRVSISTTHVPRGLRNGLISD